MSAKKRASEKKKSSPDYPQLVRRLMEASRETPASKLLPGLYIVATPLGNLGDISVRALITLDQADRIACEDTRVSGVLLSHYGIKKPLFPYHDRNADKVRPQLLSKLADGEAIVLISDAGMPTIADPGFKLVRACREAGIPVTVIPGANAALTALAGSGLPTDQFYFAGFLPAKTAARRKELTSLKNIPGTLIFYEAPQRLKDTLADLEEIFGGKRKATVARELTKLFEETKQGNLADLAAFYKDDTTKGEIVILVAPAPEQVETDIDAHDKILMQHMRTHSLRDAVEVVAAITGARRGDVYARALELKRKTIG